MLFRRLCTRYPLGEGIYDFAIRKAYFTPKKEYQFSPKFISKFSCASLEHYHYEFDEITGELLSVSQVKAAREVVDENGVILYHENLDVGLNGFWVEAKDLRVGDVFLGANGELSTLVNAVRVEQEGGIAVFNFTVEGNHNYFILAKEYEYGQSCVLVHNACMHDHHIVMKKVPKNWKPENQKALQQSHDLLRQHGIDVRDNLRNIVKNTLNKGHTIEYTKKVWAHLKSAVEKAEKAGKDAREAILSKLDFIGRKIGGNNGLGNLKWP